MRCCFRASVLAVSVLVLALLPSAGAFASWQVDGNPISIATGNQSLPQIISDGAGGAIVTWKDSRSGNNDIYAQRVNASGSVEWTTDGVALCTAHGKSGIIPRSSPMAPAAPLSRGRTIAARAPMTFMPRGWMPRGPSGGRSMAFRLGTAIGDQQNPEISSDGAGGAIVTWRDTAAGTMTSMPRG